MKSSYPSALSRTLALVPPAVALLVSHAHAASNVFLKFESVAGESTDAKHPDWIVLSSFSFGATNAAVAGVPANSVSSGLSFHKLLDKASPALFLGCAQGANYNTVTLELVNLTSNFIYYRITLNHVMISSLKSTANASDPKPGEDVTVNFDQIKIEYFYQNAAGVTIPVPAVTWNFATHS